MYKVFTILFFLCPEWRGMNIFAVCLFVISLQFIGLITQYIIPHKPGKLWLFPSHLSLSNWQWSRLSYRTQWWAKCIYHLALYLSCVNYLLKFKHESSQVSLFVQTCNSAKKSVLMANCANYYIIQGAALAHSQKTHCFLGYPFSIMTHFMRHTLSHFRANFMATALVLSII